jgi:hypothetical protein
MEAFSSITQAKCVKRGQFYCQLNLFGFDIVTGTQVENSKDLLDQLVTLKRVNAKII